MSDKKASPRQENNPTAHLLKQIQDKDRTSTRAWTALLKRCESRLRILAKFRLGARGEAVVEVDDLLQEVWIEAARKIDSFEDRGSGSLQRWLAAILNHKALHVGRKAKRVPFPESSLAGVTPENQNLFQSLSQTQPGVSQNLHREDAERQVHGALADLSDKQREAILLKVYEGLSGREAAERLGLSETGFSKRFRTALDIIGRRLKSS
jgi:RNA polymerase sigma-70 factor, ECF subfamily